MNIGDSWFSIERETTRNYVKTCPLCQGEVIFTQIGQPLNHELLEYLVRVTHMENYFDSYLEHKYIDNKHYKINVDIEHLPCGET